jgi:serine protease
MSNSAKPFSTSKGFFAFFCRWMCCLISTSGAALALAQDKPWHLGALSDAAPSAIQSLNIKPGPYRVVVAVIDSGVLAAHPSLSGQLLPGYDMLSAPNNLRGDRSTNFSPDERDARCGQRLVSGAFRTHGTEVASLIAGNGVDGVYGVNPTAKILPIRLFGACNMTRADMLDAISWAAGLPVAGVPPNPNPARIINMSIAGGLAVCGADLQQVINRVIEKKIFVVAAAGNNFHKPLPEPANCKGVISVGALDAENKIEVYSALDSRTTLYAPGGGKRLNGGSNWAVNKLKVATFDLDFLGQERASAPFRGVGTSYAAPVVAGFISLWLSHFPDKQTSDFANELPRFLRTVTPIDKCPECSPKGVTAAGGMP